MQHEIDWGKHNASEITGYSALLPLLGAEELVWVDDGSYQGDSHVVMRLGNHYGFLTFGWGSCSCCDAYEAARDDEGDLVELMNSLCRNIVWFDTLDGVKKHVSERDEANHFGYFGDVWQDFVREVKALNVQ